MAVKTKFICVSPISNEAKFRFRNEMNGFHSCKVQDEKDDLVLLESLNHQYIFWVPKQGNDHWKIEK